MLLVAVTLTWPAAAKERLACLELARSLRRDVHGVDHGHVVDAQPGLLQGGEWPARRPPAGRGQGDVRGVACGAVAHDLRKCSTPRALAWAAIPADHAGPLADHESRRGPVSKRREARSARRCEWKGAHGAKPSTSDSWPVAPYRRTSITSASPRRIVSSLAMMPRGAGGDDAEVGTLRTEEMAINPRPGLPIAIGIRNATSVGPSRHQQNLIGEGPDAADAGADERRSFGQLPFERAAPA